MDEQRWFEEIYHRHIGQCTRQARRLLHRSMDRDSITDVVQDVFLTLWRKRNALVHHPNIGGWLMIAVRLRACKHLNASQRRMQLMFSSPDTEQQHAAPSSSPIARIVYQDDLMEIAAVLGEEQARFFLAYTLGGLSARELGQHYAVSEQCVYVRICRMRRKLAAHYTSQNCA